MAFEGWRYRDPLEQLIRQEQKTCKGCQCQGWVEIGETRVNICKIKKIHGKRCESYEERE